ncbi:hypothetical protein AMS68_003770 [Peltaster fructicola]|uniref:FAD-binding domain-containing protein n=1 Tax=Peltaster fructicola TaxID=286661 RepID=A0A6H0XU50_9PEZI|nr:hypothetical protein AMS68_003770 [Peltaster fructicola]
MSLRIGIIGGGIAGLSAAISLRQHGHDIHVFERSSFDNEVGAAISLAPNASRILRGWGMELDELEPSLCERLSVSSHQEEHNFGDGDTGLITLKDGRSEKFDLILGADGVHSGLVSGITGQPRREISSGQNCYRFLVPTEKMASDPVGREFLAKIGLTTLASFGAKDRSLVIYPCRSGQLLNCAAIHSEALSTPEGSSWDSRTTRAQLQAMFEDWSSDIRKLCSLAEDVRLWPLTTRDPPKQFNVGKLLLIGDAAHPTLPHQGQGGAQAIEDASALGVLFGRDVTPEQVEERGKLFNDVRYAHSVTILFMSRKRFDKREEMMPELRKYVPDAQFPEDMFRFAWSSCPDKLAMQALSQIVAT